MHKAEIILIEIPGGYTFVEVLSGQREWDYAANEPCEREATNVCEVSYPGSKQRI